MIEIKDLNKSYKIYQKQPGFWGSVRSIFHRPFEEKKALNNINLTVQPGEMIGLIGSNGAGKTTLIKVLSGIIHPTSGNVKVMGHTPWDRSYQYRQQLALIMGQKAQLWWDLPPMDSFLLLKEIYQIPDTQFKENLDYLSEYLQIKDQLNIQVRRLSLGERMKVELIACLLHSPRIIYLDEPTIGLDIIAQKAVRAFLKRYQKDFRPIIILTSHYLQDIQELCPRIVILNRGKIIFDDLRQKLLSSVGKKRMIKLPVPSKGIKAIKDSSWFQNNQGKVELGQIHLQVCPSEISSTLEVMGKSLDLSQLSIEEIDIGDQIQTLINQNHQPS